MIRLALIGARGLVGQTVLRILEERDLAHSDLLLVALNNINEDTIEFGKRSYKLHRIDDVDFTSVDAAILCAGREVSLRYAEAIASTGCTVIDNSSAFRAESKVPLIIPELNGDHLELEHRLIANPNCSTIQLALALAPLHAAAGIDRLDVTTFQSASGAGTELLVDFETGLSNLNDDVLPCIGEVDEHGRSEEERKIECELPRILETPDLDVTATATRVPVSIGHGAAAHVQLHHPMTITRAIDLLGNASGVRLVDAQTHPGGPTQKQDAAGQDDVLVGRLRIDPADPRRLQCWIVADNLRRGAALNAVMILKRVLAVRGLTANP